MTDKVYDFTGLLIAIMFSSSILNHFLLSAQRFGIDSNPIQDPVPIPPTWT